MKNQLYEVEKQLEAYKKKYQLSLVVKGVLLTLVTIVSLIVISSIAEYTLWMSSPLRTILFISLLLIFIGLCYQFILVPFIYFINKNKGIRDEEAAKNIGNSIPSINDKLLNFIQLKSYEGNSPLVQASLNQKQLSLGPISFSSVIDLKSSARIGRYIIIPLMVVLALSLWDSQFFISSSKRLIQFNENFVPQAPFNFQITNNTLQAFENEDFTIEIELSGNSIPSSIFLIDGTRKAKVQKTGDKLFAYTYPNIKGNKSFFLEGAGYQSKQYLINTVRRPSMAKFDVHLTYPKYLKRPNDLLKNTGNLEIPEGTKAKWLFKTTNTDSIAIVFENGGHSKPVERINNQVYQFEKQFFTKDSYEIALINEFSKNSDRLNYNIDVVPDKYPSIQLNTYQDTTLYSYIDIGGNISDDYGVTDLKLFYSTNGEDYSALRIPIDKQQVNQSYYYHWKFDSLLLFNTNKLTYYVAVWDNDAINGRKSSKTGKFTFDIPNNNQIKEKINKSTLKTKNDLEETIEEAKELQNKLKETKERLKGKKELSWQDQQLIEDLMDKKKQLEQAIQDLQKQQEDINQKKDRFTEQDKSIQEKSKKLQELMNEMLDEETKKLYEELQKLLEEQRDVNQIQDLLNTINQKEDNLEKELERTLELFKRMKVEFELNETINNLKQQAEEQDKLSELSENKKSDIDDAINKQESLNNKMEENVKDFEEINELNQELENPQSMPDINKEFDEIIEHQKKQ